MNNTLIKSALLAIAISIFNVSHAEGIQLGNPAYGGSGCPAGTASATLSPDAKALSLIFDQFVVEAGGSFRTTERKTCNVAIPVHIPQGYSVSVISVDYRGYVSLPSSAQARMTAEYFMAGSAGPRFDKSFIGKTDTDYQFSNKLGLESVVWSACGADTILRVNAAMLVRTNRYNDQAMATVDSADFKTGILYQLQWRRCAQ